MSGAAFPTPPTADPRNERLLRGTASLWMAWVAFNVGASIVALAIPDRGAVVPHGFWPLAPGLAGIASGSLLLVGGRLLPQAWLGVRAAQASRPIPGWAPVVVGLIGAWPALLAMPNPRYAGLLPWPQLVAGNVLGILPFGVFVALLWRRAGAGDRVRLWFASLAVFVLHVLWVSTLGLQLLFALHLPFFEAWRKRATGSESWEEDIRIGIFHFDAAGETKNSWSHGGYYVAAEHCPDHNYDGRPRYSLEDPTPHMCFRWSGGAGFYYDDGIAPHPRLNQDVEGRLLGGWWWYVDD